jgi:LCP family protein required for cell wall assembly
MSRQTNKLYDNIELVPDDYFEKHPSELVKFKDAEDNSEHTSSHHSKTGAKRSVSAKETDNCIKHIEADSKSNSNISVNKGKSNNSTDIGVSTHRAKHTSKKHKKKKWSTRKKVLIAILLILLTIILVLGIIFAIKHKIGKDKLFGTEELKLSIPTDVNYDNIENGGETIIYKGHTYKFNHNIASILFMGIDHDEFKDDAIPATAGQADALYLMTYNISTGNIRVLSLNRDTMTEITRYDEEGNFYDSATKQLCLAYTYGDGKSLSAMNQVRAVQRLLYNIPINVYYAIDFSSLKMLNDDIGGVTVTPQYTFASFTKGQQVTLMGESAEEFVRYRDTSILDDNIRRMACQKQYLDSFAGQIVPAIKNDFKLPLTLYNHTKNYTVTNFDSDIMVYLATTLATNFNGLNITTTKGRYVQASGDKFAEFKINKKALFRTFLSLYYTKID